MPRYKIVGAKSVAGFDPGSILEESDLPNINIEALIASGHLAVVKTSKKENPNGEDSPAQSGDHDQRSGSE